MAASAREDLRGAGGGRAAETRREFELDACLGGEASQEDVFEACRVAELTEAALEGYAVTVFAFGQTGSGKTHTVVGPDFGRTRAAGGAEFPSAVRSCDGILQRGIAHAFDRAASSGGGFEYSLSVSLTEIYNEQVSDLQNAAGGALAVRHHPQRGFFVEGLKITPCKDLAGTLSTIYHGLNRRRVGAHNLNEASSRSHCLISVHVHRQGGGESRFGKITFADLAGSERLKATGSNTTKSSHRETGSINKSLFVLGKVISALSKGSGANQGGGGFVPYRDSKLTQLLIDSLGGRGRAAMLACCSPLAEHSEETLNTLHFAELALNVKSQPVVILDPQDQMILDLHATIKALRDDNRQLAEQLKMAMTGPPGSGGSLELAPAGEVYPPTEVRGGTETSPPAGGGGKPRDGGLRRGTRERLAKSRERQGARTTRSAESNSRANACGATDRKTGSPAPHQATGELGVSPYLQPRVQVRSTQKVQTRCQEQPGNCYAEPSAATSPRQKSEALEAQHFNPDVPTDSPAAPDETNFPDLDALEMAFRSKLAKTLEADGAAAGHGLSAGSGGGEEPPPEPEPEPEQAALEWAKRNPWFGKDMEMTEVAYDVHDCLVEEEKIDPSSSKYYLLLEERVREKFPDRMPPLPKRASPKKPPRGWTRDYSRSEAELCIQGEMRKLTQSVKPPLPDFRRSDTSKFSDTALLQPLPPQPQMSTPGGRSARQKESLANSMQLRHGPQDSLGWGAPTRSASKQAPHGGDDYMKKRQRIIEELRKAKEEAEIEKKKMLAMISNSLHRSGHRVF